MSAPARTLLARIVAVTGISGALLLGGCELGHKETQQTGYRGAGLDQIVDPDHVAKAALIPAPPYALPDDSGPRASQTYQNVKVLGDVSTERFNHLMAAINQWVAPPEQGCNYCHNPENMASDEKYTKVVARRMLQMTRNINSHWSSHVQKTGVTCYTCHRGNAVPQYKWALAEGSPDPGSIRGNKHGQNTPNANVGYASLPYDPFAQYLNGTAEIRVAANSPYPSPDHKVSIKDAEKTYGLMMHISTALGVNCTYCHNSQSFRSWTLSRAQRGTAYYGIRMVRDINVNYIDSLQSVFPAYRKGPHGDVYKVNCTTCHQGLSKPLGGYSMLALNPTLAGPAALAAGLRAPPIDPKATAASCNADFAHALTGKTIEFDTDAATIRPVSAPLLDDLVGTAGRCASFRMAIGGHTDATGDAAANVKLSQARAGAVESYLADRGVKPTQLSAQGFGSSRPLDRSGTPAGNQRNRRIEILVTGTVASATAQPNRSPAAPGAVPRAFNDPQGITRRQ